MSPPPPRLWRAASLELGWDMQMQPVCPACPFRGCRTARCLLHTPLHLCRQLEGWSLVSRSHTCLRVCASNVCTLVLPDLQLFPPGALLHLPSVCLSSSLLFPLFPPPPAHLCVVFLASLPPPLPFFFSATTFPFCSALRAQTAAGVRAESVLGEMLLMLQLFGLHVSFWAR